MQKLCPRVLNQYVDTFGRKADLTTMRTNPNLSQYVALDAYLHWKLHKELTKLIEAKRDNRPLESGAYNPGDRVQLRYRKRVVALDTLVFVGGAIGLISQWGKEPIEGQVLGEYYCCYLKAF